MRLTTRRRRFLLMVVMVMLASLATAMSSTRPARAGSWGGAAEIENHQAARCLGIAADGNAGIWDCTGGKDQEWQQSNQYFINESQGSRRIDYYEVKNANNQCLGIAGNSTTQGAQVVAKACDMDLEEGWRITGAVGSLSQFENLGSGEKLAVKSGDTRNGAAVVQWVSPGRDGTWVLSPSGAQFTPWGSPRRIQNTAASRCLGIAADGNAGIWDCTHNADQEWALVNQYMDSGTGLWLAYYNLVNGNGQCLGVAGNSGTQSAQVVAGSCVSGNLSQR